MLSFTGIGKASASASTNAINKIKYPGTGININRIITANKKNVIDPSRLLLKNFLFPNNLPVIAAKESANVSINREGTAIFFSNKNIVILIDINKYVAPVIPFDFSSCRNKVKNTLLKISLQKGIRYLRYSAIKNPTVIKHEKIKICSLEKKK